MVKNSKRWVLVSSLLFLLLVVLLAGCTTDEEVSQLTKVELTKDEEQLLNAAGIEYTFAFDYQMMEEEYNAIRIWVEYYKDGQYAGQRFATQTPVSKKEDREGRLMISFYKYGKEGLPVVTSIIRDKGISSSSTTLPTFHTNFGRTVGSLEKKTEIHPNESIILVGIGESEEFATGLDFRRLQEFTGEPKEFQPENQHLFVFRVMFIQ